MPLPAEVSPACSPPHPGQFAQNLPALATVSQDFPRASLLCLLQIPARGSW